MPDSFSMLCQIPLCMIPLCLIPVYCYARFQIQISTLCLIPLCHFLLYHFPLFCYDWFRYDRFRYAHFSFLKLYLIPLCHITLCPSPLWQVPRGRCYVVWWHQAMSWAMASWERSSVAANMIWHVLLSLHEVRSHQRVSIREEAVCSECWGRSCLHKKATLQCQN